MKGLGAITAITGQRQGTPWTSCQFIPGLTLKYKQAHEQFGVANLHYVWTVDRSWSTRRKPSQAQGERANSTQKGSGMESQLEPRCCEATALTSTPLRRPRALKKIYDTQCMFTKISYVTGPFILSMPCL